jgi:hypothetical protein
MAKRWIFFVLNTTLDAPEALYWQFSPGHHLPCNSEGGGFENFKQPSFWWALMPLATIGPAIKGA